MRLGARELLVRRGLRSALLFAAAAASIVWEVWPGSAATGATSVDRVDTLTVVLVLAGLVLVARPLLGPVADSPIARFLRAGAYVGLLAFLPAWATIEQFIFQRPSGDVAQLLRRVIGPQERAGVWPPQVILLVLAGLYAAVIVWATSRRARVAPATLVIGTGTGLVLGLVMYLVAPLGLSKVATNPWLPGSDIDPLVVLAWILVLVRPNRSGCSCRPAVRGFERLVSICRRPGTPACSSRSPREPCRCAVGQHSRDQHNRPAD